MLFISIDGDLRGEPCTWELFQQCLNSESLVHRARLIAKGHKNMEYTLPAVLYQGYLAESGQKRFRPTGLFVLEATPEEGTDAIEQWSRIAPRCKELNIMLAHRTYTGGLRLVAKCRPRLKSLAANRRALAQELSIDYNIRAFHSLASVAFLVPKDYFFYIDKRIFAIGEEAAAAPADGERTKTKAVFETVEAVRAALADTPRGD